MCSHKNHLNVCLFFGDPDINPIPSHCQRVKMPGGEGILII